MATIAKLNVLLSLDDGSFTRGLESSRQKLDKWGSSLRSTGTKLTAGVTAPILGAGLVVVNWASDLEQAMGKSDAVFKSSSAEVIAWSKTTADAYGFSSSESLAMASSYGALFKVMGMSDQVSADYSMGLIGLSADMAAFNDVSNERASEAIMSGLSGEYMSLRSMGVFLNEASVSQEALNIAMADGRTEITEADKVQARYNLIMEQTEQQHGQAAREMDGWAGSVARAKAKLKDMGAEIGRKLMPYALKLLSMVEGLVDWFSKLSDRTQFIIIAIAALAAAIGPVLLIIGMLLPGLSALLAVIGFLISPIGLVVVAVALLAAGLIYAYTHFEGFRNVVDAVASAIKTGAIAAFEALLRAMEPVGDLIGTIVDVFMNLKDALTSALSGDWSGAWESLKSAASGALDAIGQYIMLIPNMIMSALNVSNLGELLAKGAAWAQGLWDGAKNLWDTSIAPWFSGLAADALTWIGDTSTTLMQKGTDIVQGFFTAVQVGWTTVSTWFTDMKNKAFIAVGDTLSTLKQKGTDIIGGFYEAVTTRWVAVRTWFINMPTMIFNAIGAVLSTLKQKGTDLLTGLYMAVIDKWSIGGVRDWFSGLGGKIVNSVGSLGNSLYSAGIAIMNGLWNGLKDGWGQIVSWLSGLNPLDHKGPEQRDKKMLYPAGIWIMQGLGRGLGEGWDDVTRQLSGYTPSINGGLSDAHAGIGSGQVIHNHNYFVTPDALKEMIEGGKFAREFAGELAMSEGIA